MKNKLHLKTDFQNNQLALKAKRAIGSFLFFMAISLLPAGASTGNDTDEVLEQLKELGFENLRCIENQGERIYSFENNVYKIQTVGIKKALEIIEGTGLPQNKDCKVIVTYLDMPQVLIKRQGHSKEESKWEATYDVDKTWKKVKKEKALNNSRFKIDLLVYPQLSFQNMDITKIYQFMFSLNPAIEFSAWKGMKFSGQVILPLYVDTEGYAAYSPMYKKVRPGFITLSQQFRLPLNIKGKATVGFFNYDQQGFDLQLFRPFKKDERFSLEARLGYTSWGYWEGFTNHYNGEYNFTWSLGGNFFWPQYNVQFNLKAENYLYDEVGVRFEMIRHFKYTSISFYAMKAEHAKSNGGFRFQVALPPYRQKRHRYIPRISTSKNMGIIYNAGNERRYYKKHRAEASDNIMNDNTFNPIYITKELSNK